MLSYDSLPEATETAKPFMGRGVSPALYEQ